MSFETFRRFTKVPTDLLADNAEAMAAISGADFDDRVDALRCERYLDNALPNRKAAPSPRSLVRAAYYRARPMLPVSVRKHLQRIALRGWEKIPFPKWPVDTTADDLMLAGWQALFSSTGEDTIPFIWFWPEGRTFAAIMTHDVETAAGRDNCRALMSMEAEFGIRSSFEIVPEVRYEVPEAFLESIRKNGCEVCLHGLNHDGHLFVDETEFRRRAELINDYLVRFGASGFRSPVMYRRADWMSELKISYDMSFPNVAHLDPQRGGCCTVMPYFIGDILELPLTTIQDYPLQNILNCWSSELWRRQADIVAARHGLLSFIIHPDYCFEPRAVALYRELLGMLADNRAARGMWAALPGEVDCWWRRRDRMELRHIDGRWTIEGEGSGEARLAFAKLGSGTVTFTIGDGPK